jgi:hypothetical protein
VGISQRGAHLGVEAMTLHYYVPGKDILLDGYAALGAGDVPSR